MGLGLTVVLGFPIIAIIVGLVRWGGEYFYFYVWSFLFVISILMLTIYPTLIAPLFNKYTKLDKGKSIQISYHQNSAQKKAFHHYLNSSPRSYLRCNI